MANPKVLVVVPTKNSESTLAECLNSIRRQTYNNTEIIVVDNNSTDKTPQIARNLADKFFTFGPERSAQVNYGVKNAVGDYVYKVDSDFILDESIIGQCVNKIAQGYDAIVVHNSPDVRASWIAKLRKFEVDMYKYDLKHSSARFVKKEVYLEIGGFDEKITFGEDYDFQNRLNRAAYKTGFIPAEALHLGEPKSFWAHMARYYAYGKDSVNYLSANKKEARWQLSFFRGAYFRNWRKFVGHPLVGAGFIIYSLCKFFFAGLGLVMAKIQR